VVESVGHRMTRLTSRDPHSIYFHVEDDEQSNHQSLRFPACSYQYRITAISCQQLLYDDVPLLWSKHLLFLNVPSSAEFDYWIGLDWIYSDFVVPIPSDARIGK
jgi:hypothetical protein